MFTKFLVYQRLFSILSLCIKTAKCHGVQMCRLGTGTFVPASAYKVYQVFKCPLLLNPSSDRAEIFHGIKSGPSLQFLFPDTIPFFDTFWSKIAKKDG